MRIDPKAVAQTPTAPRETVAVAPTTLAPARAGAAPPAGASIVKLSSAGAAASADSTSPTVTARLDRIRTLLDRGEYPVDLDQLAARIVDDDMLRSTSGRE